MLTLILSAIIIMIVSLIGVFSVWKRIGARMERNLSFLVSFSAGVFLVITWHMAEETIEHASSVSSGLLWIFGGAVLIWLIFRFLPAFHQHPDTHEISHSHVHLDARRLLVSDALHNMGDGILLAAAFVVSTTFGILTAASIFVHELVQEVSEFFVLRQAGFTTKKALIVNFIVSGTILVGTLGGYYLLETFEALETPLLGIAAGSFFVVVLHDLIPHSVRTSRNTRGRIVHGAWFLAGLLVMITLNLIALPHA